MKNMTLNLTFCLFLIPSFLIAPSFAESEFESVPLNTFYEKATKVKAATLDGVELCKLFHKSVSLTEESKYKLEVYNTKSLSDVSDDDIKEILLDSERKDKEFWDLNKVEIKPRKLNTLNEIISSNVFNNLISVVDNIYCFPYLGVKFDSDAQRKMVVQSLSGIESKIKALIYYDDGFYSKTVSVLIVYLLDSEKNEVYALKGIIK